MTPLAHSLFALPAEERLELVWALWDSLEKEQIPIPKEVLDEMERRVDAYFSGGDPGEPWDVVRKRIESKL